jgi:hypothetical protein
MGGVAIDAREWRKQYLPNGDHGIWYLGPEAIQTALKWDPTLSNALTSRAIEDRSKTNALARVIVCTQAFWFMAQCTSRFAQSLPITLLEVSHAACHPDNFFIVS